MKPIQNIDEKIEREIELENARKELLGFSIKMFMLSIVVFIGLILFKEGLKPMQPWNDLSLYGKTFYFLFYTALSASIIVLAVSIIVFFWCRKPH